MDLEKLILPKLELVEERPITSDDFTTFIRDTEKAVQQLDLTSISTTTSESTPTSTASSARISSTLIFISEHTPLPECEYDEEQLVWSSETISSTSASLKVQLEDWQNCSFKELLDRHLSSVLDVLEPKLRDWQHFPTACHAAVYIVKQLSTEKIGEIFGQLLPHVLRWSDSWLTRPRLLAARLLDTVLDLPETDLVKFGRDKVVYDTLVRYINCDDTCLLEAASSPLQKVVEITTRTQSRRSLSQIDHFVDKLFTAIDLESRTDRKRLKLLMLGSSWQLLREAAPRWIHKLSKLVASEVEIGSRDAGLCLQLWNLECKNHPKATGMEGRVMYPALVKILWRMCNGYLGEDIIAIQDLVTSLSLQIKTDPGLFIKYTRNMKEATDNVKFLQYLDSSYSQALEV